MSGLKPTALEIALLPKFCWGQMNVPHAAGPEYNIPRGCGFGMNHYCPGLVWLTRAKRASSERDRHGFLRRASGEVRYTIRAIEKFPGCPVRPHIEQTVAEIESLYTPLRREEQRSRPASGKPEKSQPPR
jgi:hypothetical protein